MGSVLFVGGLIVAIAFWVSAIKGGEPIETTVSFIAMGVGMFGLLSNYPGMTSESLGFFCMLGTVLVNLPFVIAAWVKSKKNSEKYRQ